MERERPRRLAMLIAVTAIFSLAGGCALRPPAAGTAAMGAAAPEASAAAEPTEAVTYTVEYRLGGALLAKETVPAGDCPAAEVQPQDVRLLGWTGESGEAAVPTLVPVWSDTVYYAVTRPLLRADAEFLFPNEYGLLQPESPFTNLDAARAVRALLPDTGPVEELLTLWDAAPEDALPAGDFRALCEALFTPEEVREVLPAVLGEEAETLTRVQAAWCLARLRGAPPAGGEKYYPDVSPSHWAAAELAAAAAPGALARDALMEQTKDGFLWFGGYLYRLDEDGYFLTGQEYDSLTFDPNGRYTCGNEELDGYVARTIAEFTSPESTRLENLHALYYHVKNDFQYLRRNYYASGATGWDIDEALTIFRTNKGNCYCYSGAFCALARGMGYNARTYSGTIGVQEQPHAWTEITLEDGIYICDPEIEMNYWTWLQNYTDNFMMPREKSGGWNYIALGRTVIYE